MKIIIGLGNIGEKYENTRHNVGFRLIQRFTDQKKDEISFTESKRLNAYLAKSKFKGKELLFVLPTTYMNNSGEAVQKILQFYKEKPQNMVVVYDDIDLPLGKIRTRKSGSAGTHNGMRSIIEAIGKNFTRIRIGIESRGEYAPNLMDLSSFVLGKFSNKEQTIIEESIEQGIKELKNWILAKN
ncbi:aminoacyl-tRNA hydrolase [Patescibacteria group bacterium]|nr:aminoacyl-tRNA hydrolase [Patescibacteria group bacterium]